MQFFFNFKDINECTEKLNSCDQLCINTNGNYSCSCFPGFDFNGIKNTCERIDNGKSDFKFLLQFKSKNILHKYPTGIAESC